ncbi:uncharacterized protein LAJ45_10282 [Morchella importuna]|uniref:uncharacterized protein n=1 Tax=Morchella importuna TaxID=1174673 RepID=UPI001E8D95EA|nr:uncharacterized protein LAJ45_10282 [Morchella importuna]KAH8145642.1 hypothetical protein LAJ45_10282 [Morchella importuna]
MKISSPPAKLTSEPTLATSHLRSSSFPPHKPPDIQSKSKSHIIMTLADEPSPAPTNTTTTDSLPSAPPTTATNPLTSPPPKITTNSVPISKTAGLLSLATHALNHITSPDQRALLSPDELKYAVVQLTLTVQAAAKLAEAARLQELHGDTERVKGETERFKAETVKVKAEAERAVVETELSRAEAERKKAEAEGAV